MNKRDQIHEASDQFADAIKTIVGDGARVSVFYIYLDGDTWVSGDSGNQNWIERIGALRFLQKLQDEGEVSRCKCSS